MKSTKFTGLTVLITGASSGIGLAFSQALAEQGANLILTARSKEKLHELAEYLKKKRNIWVEVIPNDLSQPNGARELFNQASHFKVDVLINCAGFGKWSSFSGQSMSTYRDMLNLNISSLVELNYLFLPLMSENNMSGVINVASTAAFQPVPFQSVYAASKSFVLNFSEALAGEYKDKGIRVLALCPGYTETNFMNVANGSPDGIMTRSTPEDVALSALSAFYKKKSYLVPGISNYVNSLLPRLLSRKAVINIIHNIFKKRVLT